LEFLNALSSARPGRVLVRSDERTAIPSKLCDNDSSCDDTGGSEVTDRRVLLTVSGTIPATLDADVEAGRRPRADYRVLAEHLDADVVDVQCAREQGGRFSRLLAATGEGPLLAWYAWRRRRRYDVIMTDGEQVGLPLAVLIRWLGSGGTRHAMIVHVVSVPKKERLVRWTRISGAIDRWIVYSSAQAEFIRRRFGVPEHRVVLTSFMVDTLFFTSGPPPDQGRPMICSAGLERRDYPTLVEAVRGLDIDVVIAAASPWSRQTDSSKGVELPSNVTIERLSLHQLRDLYARSQFVVLPLLEVDFQAGITTILEAMSMCRAVVCSRTAGQTDTIVDGLTGLYVPPRDADALRRVIQHLTTSRAECRSLGAAGRKWVLTQAELDRYAERLSAVVRSLSPTS
jgi:glycosyltransferase involved in cell wall biosynthesis